MDWKSAIARFGSSGKTLILNGRRLVVPSKKPFRFAVVSDLHVDSSTQGAQNDFDNALTKLVANGVERIFCCGDVVTNSSASSFAYFTQVLDQHPGIPFASCKGNHDYSLDDYVWSSGIKCDSANYVIEAGGCVFVMMSIDTSSNNITQPYSSDTLQWLQNVLAQNYKQRVFVFMHYPINPNDSTVQFAGLRKGGSSYQYGYAYGSAYSTQLLNILNSHGNLIAFSGHSHYEFGVNNDYPGIVKYEQTSGSNRINLVHVPSLAIPRDKNHNTISSGQPASQPSQCFIVDVYDDYVSVKGMELNLTQSSTGEVLEDYSYTIQMEPRSTPTAMDYVQSGLLTMWDGIENAGYGIHSSSASTWKNLASTTGTYNLSRTMVSWNDDSANFVRQNVNSGTTAKNVFRTSESNLMSTLSGEWTIEIVARPDSGYFNNYSGVFGDHASVDTYKGKLGLVGLQYENGDIRCGLYGKTSGGAEWLQYFTSQTVSRSINDRVSAGVPFHFAMQASETNHVGKIFINGQLVYSITLPSGNAVLGLPVPFSLGAAWSASTDRFFSGKVYSARTYTRMLDASEIATNYQIDQTRFSI